MRLRWLFGVSQPDLEQPERDLLAPVRDLYEPCDVHQAWWTAHLLLDGARRPVVPSTVRRPFSDRGRVSGASAPACGRLVPGRINGDLDITLRTCLPPAIKLFMLLEAAMLRYCGIMAPNVEGAVTRARDSARPAARRPGPRDRAGPVSVLRRPQRRLRGGERVRFMTICPRLSRIRSTNSVMTKGDMAPENAQDEGITHGKKTGAFAFVRRD